MVTLLYVPYLILHVYTYVTYETYERFEMLRTVQYSSNAIHYPVYSQAYDEIRINNKAYSSQEEMKAVNALTKELQNFTNKPFPKHIDNQFAVLAENRKFEQPFNFFFIVPMKRIVNFWWLLPAVQHW